MSIGIWQPQGVVVAPVSSDTPGQPNVLYEAGAKILSGTVFKMWFGSANGVCYAESTDGLSWTRYVSNPIIVPTGTPSAGWNAYPRIFKNGSTYYAYVVNPNFLSMSSWSSPDGVTWTLGNASLFAGSNFTGQLSVLDKVGGTWYGYYTAYNGTQYQAYLATSADLINWTGSGSPTITSGNPSNFCFQKVGSKYYGWSQMIQNGIPHFASNGLPSDISRYSATSVTGPWTGPLAASTIYRTTAASGIGLTVGQVADPSIVSANGNLYMYATVTPTGNGAPTNYQIAAFTAPSTTYEQLIQTYEGVQNIPQPGTLYGFANQLNTLASDNFTRANANPIGGNWSTTSASGNFVACQIVSNLVEAAGVTTVRGGSFWNALTWGPDQWASATVAGLTTSNGSEAGVMLRSSTTGAATAYLIYCGNTAGPIKQVRVDKIVAGTFTGSIFSVNYTWNVGSVLTASIIGTTISVYVDGNLVITGTDSSIATGAPGMVLFAGAALTDAQINAWSAGNFSSTIGGNAGVAGATISDGTNTTTSDGNGDYILSPEVGVKTITPSLAGYTFSPASSSQTASGADITSVNFTANMIIPIAGDAPMIHSLFPILKARILIKARQMAKNKAKK